MSGKPTLRPPREPARDVLTAKEIWYLEWLRWWWHHHNEAPTMAELAEKCGKSVSATYGALVSAEHKGHVKRVDGKFNLC